MWRSPHFSSVTSGAGTVNGVSLPTNQPRFPTGVQQQVIQSIPRQSPMVRGEGMPSFQQFASPPVLPSPSNPLPFHQVSPRGPQISPPPNQLATRPLMHQPSPKLVPSPVTQNPGFCSPLLQSAQPFNPSCGVMPQQSRMVYTRPSSSGLVAPTQRPSMQMHYPTYGGIMVAPSQPIVPYSMPSCTVGVLSSSQQQAIPSNVPVPGGIIRPQQPSTSWAVPCDTKHLTPPERALNPFATPFSPHVQIPFSSQGHFSSPTVHPSNGVPSSQRQTTPLNVCPPGEVRSSILPPRPFTPSTVQPAKGINSSAIPLRPFVSSAMPPSGGFRIPRPITPTAVSPSVGIHSSHLTPRSTITSSIAQPLNAMRPPTLSQRPFTPSTAQHPGRIPAPILSPRPLVPSTVPPATRSISSPNLHPILFAQSTTPPTGVAHSQNVPPRPFEPCTLPFHGKTQSSPPVKMRLTAPTSPLPGRFSPSGNLSPPQQPFGQSTFPLPRGVLPPRLPSSTINTASPKQLLSSQQLTASNNLPASAGITSPIHQTSWHGPRPLNPKSIPSPIWQLPLSSSQVHLQNPQSFGQGSTSPVQQNRGSRPMQHVKEAVVVPGQGKTSCRPQLPVNKQINPIGQSACPKSQVPANPYTRASQSKHSKQGERRRDHGNRSAQRNQSSRPRVSRCFSPPPPNIKRVIKFTTSEEYYTKKKDDQENKCHLQGTEKLIELHVTFEKEIINMVSLEQGDNDVESVSSKESRHKHMDDSDMESLVESDSDESPVKSRLQLFPSDDEGTSDGDSSGIGSHALSDSNFDSDNNDDDDEDDDNDVDDDDSNAGGGLSDDELDNAGNEENCHKGPSVAEIRKRKIEDPRRLHPELWFNELGETNDGPVCRCSSADKGQGIRHGIYPGESAITPCDPLTNNSAKIHHYWITVTPHTNFMTSNPSVIHAEGKDFTFEGFSLFSHHPLEEVPLCSVIRFNIEYTLHVVSQPVPENFCMKDLDLFSEFLFYKVLELEDWNFNGNIKDSCQRYHFMPRFIHRSTDNHDSKHCHELLPMSQVLSHVISSAQPLIQLKQLDLSKIEKWQEYVKSCRNAIVMNPAKKPAALRVDDMQFCKEKHRSCKSKVYPDIIHHSIRPVQMSFAGDAKYQRLLKTHNKLRNLISNTPIPSRKNQDKLVKLKIELEKMRLTSSMRRDVLVEVGSKGMIKTGLKSDMCQHALLLPVLVHHLRYHACLHSLDKKIGYEFKDRSLLQMLDGVGSCVQMEATIPNNLALTHPSYYLNFGMNPDHARNSLSNCGVKKPRYGDRKVRQLHTRKKGITQLIRVMSNLGKMEENQSIFADNNGALALSESSSRQLIGLRKAENKLERIRHNERLEFLGDSVLELICSAHLYFMLPYKPEGGLAMYRSALVQNKHLAQLAQKLGLSDYMQYSHGPDLCLEEDLNHAMANCFEALLGAIYLESGLKPATQLFTQLAFDEEELREVWTNLPKHPLQARQPNGDRHLIASSELLQKLQEFEQVSGIEFTHIRLLARAFTHAQVGYNNLTLGSNQRMEFLGDSVLQFVVSVYLYKHFSEHHEGHLTLLRSSLVNHRVQAKISRELGLDKLINFGGQAEVKGFREKLLADVLEAFVAALYVDKGLRHVEVFCRVCLFPRLEEFIINQDWMDAKSQLQQCCLTSRDQGKTPDLPQYKVLQNIGPAHHKHYTVAVYLKNRRLGSGEGKSIQQAEMAAAKDALASHYFPELARQKRLLDRKHQGRRRNYWNKVPRRESDKQYKKDEEFTPQWEEMETFETQQSNREEKGRDALEEQAEKICDASENWEPGKNDNSESWEEESNGWKENWEDKEVETRGNSEGKEGTGREDWENEKLEEEQVRSGEIWNSENRKVTETGKEEKCVDRENWQGDLNDAKENWEEEVITMIEISDGEEKTGRENWENEVTVLKENWEEELIDEIQN